MTKRKIKKSLIIFSILNLILTIVISVGIISLKVLPLMLVILLIAILLLLNLLCFFLIKKNKKKFRVIGYIISVILIIMCSIGSYYIFKTNSFLNKAFNNSENKYTNTYYVLVEKNSDLEDIKDVSGSEIGYYEMVPNIDDALNILKKETNFGKTKYDDINKLFNDLKKEKIDATVIEKSIYEVLTDEENKVLNKSDYKIIYKFDLEVEEEKEEIIDDGNSLSIYIGGVDFTEKNTDFNMVMTINKKTHKILLTSIPRDFYVKSSDIGMSELMGYVGYYGINASRKAAADLFNTKIDYYIKINTESIVGLVDTLGGVEFCSDYDFITTHSMIQGSYDDSVGEKLHVTKGCKKYNGIQLLTILRERKAYPDGDRQRQKNCQIVMITIMKSMLSANGLANYSNVLNSVSNLYTTNLSRDTITEIINDTISSGKGWSFDQQSVTGRDSSGYVHMGTIKDYVMIPDENSINAAKDKIKSVVKSK